MYIIIATLGSAGRLIFHQSSSPLFNIHPHFEGLFLRTCNLLPCAHAQQGSSNRFVCLSLARKSPVLEIYASVCNKSKDIYEKLPSVLFKLLIRLHKLCKSSFSLQHACGLPTPPILLAG